MAPPVPLDLEGLRGKVNDGSVDTVLACMVDMQGRLMGKRFHAGHFIATAWQETHCCNYLLATDLEMATPDGYAATSWAAGYGDYLMKPDLATLRPLPWLDKTALVLCDVLDHHGHAEVAHSPRAMLKRQVARARALGFEPMAATELEFMLFGGDYEALRAAGYRGIRTHSAYNEDYHILQTTKEEHVMQPVRNGLWGAGIPVESTKGEAGVGQQELNITYADALATAEHHTIAKHAVKEIAWQHGRAATFMAKWDAADIGSATHIHQSLARDGANAFADDDDGLGMSMVMKRYVAGLVKYAPDCTYFLAPYVNSYKRFAKGTFAPTRMVWSVDNRTAGFRLCGANSASVRIENRIGGADLNPYLALSAQLAAGLKGIEEELAPVPAFTGDAYADDSQSLPGDLAAARAALHGSGMLREALGDEVVDHYCRCAEVELEDFATAVTDHELVRGFEKS